MTITELKKEREKFRKASEERPRNMALFKAFCEADAKIEGYKLAQKEMLSFLDNKDLLEHLSDLEHDQWIHWTSYMLENLTEENKERWYAQCNTPYPELSDKEQESDRKFARIVIEEIKEKLKEFDTQNSPLTTGEKNVD